MMHSSLRVSISPRLDSTVRSCTGVAFQKKNRVFCFLVAAGNHEKLRVEKDSICGSELMQKFWIFLPTIHPALGSAKPVYETLLADVAWEEVEKAMVASK